WISLQDLDQATLPQVSQDRGLVGPGLLHLILGHLEVDRLIELLIEADAIETPSVATQRSPVFDDLREDRPHAILERDPVAQSKLGRPGFNVLIPWPPVTKVMSRSDFPSDAASLRRAIEPDAHRRCATAGPDPVEGWSFRRASADRSPGAR